MINTKQVCRSALVVILLGMGATARGAQVDTETLRAADMARVMGGADEWNQECLHQDHCCGSGGLRDDCGTRTYTPSDPCLLLTGEGGKIRCKTHLYHTGKRCKFVEPYIPCCTQWTSYWSQQKDGSWLCICVSQWLWHTDFPTCEEEEEPEG